MPRPAALEGNLVLLRQGLELLDHLSDSAWREAAPDHSTVGAQYRHILDHYHCLLEGLTKGTIDYDQRRRDPTIESERQAAHEATLEVLDRLRLLGKATVGLPVQVIQAPGADAPAEPQGSSLGRELLFLVSHTVHHFAIIKLLLEERGVTCHPDFGMAPSTLAHRQAVG
jgi:hypothetical protein